MQAQEGNDFDGRVKSKPFFYRVQRRYQVLAYINQANEGCYPSFAEL